MRKIISISVLVAAVLMALAVGMAFVTGPGGIAPMQTTLDAYSQFQFGRLRVVLQVEQISRARKPDALAEAMSASSYAAEGSPFAVTAVMRTTRARPTPGGKAIPYPPKEVWCARLNIDESANVPRYVFVAHHADAAGDAWIVHEPPLAKGAARQISDALGCAP